MIAVTDRGQVEWAIFLFLAVREPEMTVLVCLLVCSFLVLSSLVDKSVAKFSLGVFTLSFNIDPALSSRRSGRNIE